MTRILVIDDEAPIRHVLRIHLTNASYEVECASTGLDGIRMALGGGFDLVLCDLKLPDILGLDIIKTLRNDNPTLPILAISGFIDNNVIDEVNKLSYAAYLSKPFLKEELFKAIDSILVSP